MVFHRMLCHKAFSSPKWWEYTMAYFGILNIQVRHLLRNLKEPKSCCLCSYMKKTLTMLCSPTEVSSRKNCTICPSVLAYFTQELQNLYTLLVYSAPLAANVTSSYCAASYSMLLLSG